MNWPASRNPAQWKALVCTGCNVDAAPLLLLLLGVDLDDRLNGNLAAAGKPFHLAAIVQLNTHTSTLSLRYD